MGRGKKAREKEKRRKGQCERKEEKKCGKRKDGGRRVKIKKIQKNSKKMKIDIKN